MAVKANEGRWRYIAFKVEGEEPPGRGELLSALLGMSRRSRLGDDFRITVYENGLGILKVPHTLKDDAIEVLNSVSAAGGRAIRVTALRTSGTIKTLKERYRRQLGDQRSIEE